MIKRKYKAWAGIVSNAIHKTKEADTEYKIMAIYPSKKTAKLAYECVLLCEIKLLTTT